MPGSERSREERLEELVRDLYADATRAGGRVSLSSRENWDLLHEVTGVREERVRG